MDLIGKTIQHYEFRKLIASGGYGAVYEAMDKNFNRLVAIKTILPDYANQEEFKQRFTTEAQLVAQLEHPHIVPIYHYWQDEQGAFLVMRYIKGGTLRDVMSVQGIMSLIQIQRILRQVCDALDVSHSTGVVHRDIKPENILIDPRGNAYLTDFGIAKNVHTPEDMTATDSIVGTWKYLSPEQIQNQPLSPMMDMYALGVMVYELLAGQHPFEDTVVTMMLLKHLQDPLPNILLKQPNLPLTINDVIQKATQKNPASRYPSITAFANAFTNVVDGIPMSLPVADTRLNITKPLHIPPPLPTTTKGRNRHAMLQNVRKFWIEGVLETSLQHVGLLDINISPEYESVNHPWQKLLNIRRSDTDEPLGSQQIMTYFENLSGKLLVMGAPGAGKTTMLLSLTQELIIRAQLDPAYPIPVVLNLSTWSQNRLSLEDWLEDELHIKYQTPRRIAREWIEGDNLTLMLDGLDEVDTRHRAPCVQAINTYREQHGFVDIVLCCRTSEYQELITKVMLNGAIRIEQLTDTQVTDYLGTLDEVGKRTQRLIDADPTFLELSRSPLTLRILVQTYRNVPTDHVKILDNPIDQRRQLFNLYYQEMINRRVTDGQYDTVTIRKHLTWLAKQMRIHNLSIFQIEDLQPSWLDVPDKKTYQRLFISANMISQAGFWGLPRLLQAGEITGLSNIGKTLVWSTTGGIWGIALGTGAWRKRLIPWLSGIVFALGIAMDSSPEKGFGALADVPISFVIYGGMLYATHILMNREGFTEDHIRTVELLAFSRQHIRPLYAILGIMSGIATAFINDSVYNGDPATTTELLVGMTLGALTGAIGAILISGFRGSPSAIAIRPNQGMRHTLRNAVQMGLYIGFIFSLSIFMATAPVSTISFGITQGIISALSFGFLGFIIFGGYAVIQHLIVRHLLVRRGHIEPNLAHFLDTASSLLLMRKVGSGYIFIHRYLLEYFAELEDSSN